MSLESDYKRAFEELERYAVYNASCDKCIYTWVAVLPMSSNALNAVECPECFESSGAITQLLSVHAPGRKPICAIGISGVSE